MVEGMFQKKKQKAPPDPSRPLEQISAMDPLAAGSVFDQCGVAAAGALIISNVGFRHAFFSALQQDLSILQRFVNELHLLRETDIKQIVNMLPMPVLESLFKSVIRKIRERFPGEVLQTLTTNGKVLLTCDIVYFDNDHKRYVQTKHEFNVYVREVLRSTHWFAPSLPTLLQRAQTGIRETVVKKFQYLFKHDVIDMKWVLHDVFVIAINFENRTMSRSLFHFDIPSFKSKAFEHYVRRVASVKTVFQMTTPQAKRQIVHMMQTTCNIDT